MSAVRIQRLYEADWERFREVRLRALQQDPQAFSTTAAEAAQLTGAEWRARLRARAAFVADDGGRLVGLVSGIADQLVEAVVGWAASEGYARVRLCVIDGNQPAERLYRRRGFRPTGERQPAGRGDRMESVMERPLGPTES